ncbi:MAG: HAMP domain-containing sensor histidine kinase [Longimicrobiales bacterium]|nr:HAMP domain-containing sensor histidine kinase [Longimicrobiales bacterium]
MVATPAEIEDILDRWLRHVRTEVPEEKLSDTLIESYRDLARFVLERELADAEADDVTHNEGELDQLLAAVARANRQASMNISTTLACFGHLSDEILSEVSGDDVSEEAIRLLRATLAVDRVLGRSLGRLVRILESSAERARRERAGALGTMMDVLSHELDNRLGAVRTATDMLDNPRIELGAEDLRRVGRLVRSSLDDALKTVDDVQALVASWGDEAGASKGQTLRLSVLLRRIVEDLEHVAQETGVRLTLDPGPTDVEVDAARGRLILYNLVSNGIRYRDPGRNDARVDISWERQEDGGIRIRVTDNGIGITEEDHETIFLYRARVDEKVDGSGLGLAIAREAVEQLGGDLSVESALGEGSTFTVTLRPET